jgi:uncharacterized membrane protein YgdD (TMEM256/DUF423 family)
MFPELNLTRKMSRYFFVAAAFAGAIAVGLGAFGAHYIKDLLSPSRFDVYLTGTRYLLVHAVVLLIAARMYREEPSRLLSVACFAFIVGMIAFSGSLVILGLTGFRLLGAVAPIGGAGYISGWLLLAIVSWRSGDESSKTKAAK